MNKVKAPYNVSKLASKAGRDAFRAVDVMRGKVRRKDELICLIMCMNS
jgi:histidinol-phosphate/aromatic aminotransferase/cobyric acid decarboxylase-like protein